ncbi:hypothetical protein PAHAL_2G049100 [Panicum hallii]|uniref:Uncharacterized protein n=1 Tax=Panicum hallii TaxID=206008 RepID=A0A2T8KMX6_9POAL|nr:hypothetical protein PAHAL_2G049100 [Panicum hallii]
MQTLESKNPRNLLQQSHLKQTNQTNSPCSPRNSKNQNELLLMDAQFWLFLQPIWNGLRGQNPRTAAKKQRTIPPTSKLLK